MGEHLDIIRTVAPDKALNPKISTRSNLEIKLPLRTNNQRSIISDGGINNFQRANEQIPFLWFDRNNTSTWIEYWFVAKRTF